MAELGRLASSGLPEWIALAVTLLGIAWRVARNFRASAQRQGERIGELERRADLERTRRQQIESVLCDDGLRLPLWPPDGPLQRRPARSFLDDEDEPATTEVHRPPVPASRPRH